MPSPFSQVREKRKQIQGVGAVRQIMEVIIKSRQNTSTCEHVIKLYATDSVYIYIYTISNCTTKLKLNEFARCLLFNHNPSKHCKRN